MTGASYTDSMESADIEVGGFALNAESREHIGAHDVVEADRHRTEMHHI